MIIYTVKPGDSIYSIGKKYGIPYNRILADNMIANPNKMSVGQNLVLMANEMKYIVQENQSLYSIAQNFGLSVETLLEANPNVNPFNLNIGTTIVVPASEETNDKRSIIVNGYVYPSVTQSTLNCIFPNLTYISIFSYSINPDGALSPLDDEAIIRKAYGSGVMPFMVVTNISSGQFSTETLSGILADENLQNALIENILSEMKLKGYYGTDIDMEYISPSDRQAYNEFLVKLVNELHKHGFVALSSIAPKTSADQKGVLYEAHDYEAQGKIMDYILIMTYEWGYTYGPPLAVSPINQVRKVLDYAVTAIPSEKILMGMPNYGYDWALPYMRGTAARSVSNLQATELAQKYKVEIKYDEKAQAPYFNYLDESGKLHIVWFDDAKSIEARLKLVDEYNLAGVAYWNLQNCYIPNWLVLQNMYNVKKI